MSLELKSEHIATSMRRFHVEIEDRDEVRTCAYVTCHELTGLPR